MDIKNIKNQIQQKEKELEALRLQLAEEQLTQEWVPFEYQGKKWEVQKHLNPEVTSRDLKIPEGCRLMDVLMAGYIHSHVPEVNLTDDWEWIEQFSDKHKDKGWRYAIVGLDSGGGRLGVGGDWDDDGDDGYAFGVRFVREIQ